MRPRPSGRVAVATVKALPADDDGFGPGQVRADGRTIHPNYLFQAKTPAAGQPPLETLGVAEARRRYEAVTALRPPPRPAGRVKERAIDGPGGPLRIRAYHPSGAAAGPRPVLVFFHGSGFVLLERVPTSFPLAHIGPFQQVHQVEVRLAHQHRPEPGLLDAVPFEQSQGRVLERLQPRRQILRSWIIVPYIPRR